MDIHGGRGVFVTLQGVANLCRDEDRLYLLLPIQRYYDTSSTVEGYEPIFVVTKIS